MSVAARFASPVVICTLGAVTTLLDDISLVDHHCHGIVAQDRDRAQFEALLTEADAAGRWHGTLFDTQIGMAVRRFCAPMLDLPRHATADEYLARRLELGHDDVARRLLSRTGISDFLVDTGLTPELVTSPDQLAGYAGARSAHIIRLERVAEDVIQESGGARYADEFGARLTALAADAVGLKSIAAYRVGLDIAAERPDVREVDQAARRWAADISAGAPVRLCDDVVIRNGIWTAIDIGLPLQFHVGYGDRDVDLARCDPLLLMPLLRATASSGVPIMLLHNYPFHRQAGFLAQVFDHVFVDVGLALHNVGARARAVLGELLELAPFGSVLFSTDGYGLPELFYVSTTLFRRALDAILSDGIADDAWSASDAERLAAMICAGNARRGYRLPG
jgi:uncharacterized protein